MTKFDQIWYLLHICYRFATFVNPFFGAVLGAMKESKEFQL